MENKYYTPQQLEQLTQVATKAIRNKFDTRDTVTALDAIDDAINCGLHELANDMAKDFLSEDDKTETALFRAHFKTFNHTDVTLFRVFDASVRAVIFDSINPGHSMAKTPVS